MPNSSAPELPLPKRLRSARLREGMSQRELGINAKIDPDSASARINQYEQGKHAPDYKTAARLAECLKVPVTYLYTPDDRVAELILLFDQLSEKSQVKVLQDISELKA